jgi:methyl-accepting chemotaxis protein
MEKVGIIGAGKGAVVLLHYLLKDKNVTVVGIFSRHEDSPAVQPARENGIPFIANLEDLARRADLTTLFEVTGSAEVRARLMEIKAPWAALIDSEAAGFFVERIRAAGERSLKSAGMLRERFDEIHGSLDEGIGLIQEALDATEDIANQTQILSVNAAIEAAHAPGESGRTFSVVASQIGHVAANTKTATTGIQRILASFRSQNDSIDRIAGEMVEAMKSSGL